MRALNPYVVKRRAAGSAIGWLLLGLWLGAAPICAGQEGVPAEPGAAGAAGEAGGQDESPPVFKGRLVDSPPPAAPEEKGKSPAAPVVTARLVTAPGHHRVREVRRWRAGAGRVDWQHQGEWIAFDELGSEGRHHLYLQRADGTSEKCLTCDHYDLRKLNTLSPVWHPSGEYLVFQAQQNARKLKLDPLRLASAYRGLHSDLWLITRDGRRAWQLTQLNRPGYGDTFGHGNSGAVVDPHFSHEADRLVWSQRMDNTVGRWGEWVPQVAEIELGRIPKLGKIRGHKVEGIRGFVVAHGFTPNDRGLFVSVPGQGGGERGRDVLRLDLDSGVTERLTATADFRDDLVFVSPRSDAMIWVSNRNVPSYGSQQLPWKGDLWAMSKSRLRQERLTHFNDPESKHYLGEALIDDVAWGPEGDRLMLHVVSVPAQGAGELDEGIYLVELEGTLE